MTHEDRLELVGLNESTIRSRAKRLGYRIDKSRRRTIDIDNHGQYMLVDSNRNCVVLGSRYDATLDEIDDYLREQKAA